MPMDGEDLTSLGKLFHNFGAHTENALSPKVVALDLGTLILVIGTQFPLILVWLNQFTEICWCESVQNFIRKK